MEDTPGVNEQKESSRMKVFLVMAGMAMAILAAVLAFSKVDSAYAIDQTGCLSCHSNYKMTKANGQGQQVSLYVAEEALQASAHRYIDCTTCHTTKPHEVPTPLTKLSLAQKCGSCHDYQFQVHRESVHGQQLLRGNLDVATCVDCHSPTGNPHSVIRVLEAQAPAYKKNQAQTCGKCHGNEELMSRYGIVEKVYESYMRSFHGKATRLGSSDLSKLDKASCINCHGTHDIKSVSDPVARVAGLENLARTCESCHPGAGMEFAKGFPGHEEASPKHLPAVYYVGRFFVWLTAGVLAFGAMMVTLELTRLIPINIKVKPRKKARPREK
ncbi:MAG: hypothetical protein HW414_1350 [Dehalococcoidia bacterium]|nr:hypothetical protein [Dehalococcoidia bacterium]